MGIKKFEEMESRLQELNQELGEKSKLTAEQVEELSKEVMELKKLAKKNITATPEKATDKEVEKVKDVLFIKSLVTGMPAKSFDEYKILEEKALVPDDLQDWLAEEFLGTVYEDLQAMLELESIFPKFTLPRNRETLSIPAVVDNIVTYRIQPAQDAIESALGAGKISFKTDRLKALVTSADQADLETIPFLTPLIRAKVVRSIKDASEKAIVRGDVNISDVNDVRKSFDGLLKMAKDAGNVVDNGGAKINIDNILEARAKLGLYGLRPADLVVVVNPKVGYDLLNADDRVTTLDKYGSMATLIRGEIGKVWGMSIVVSSHIPENMNADGSDDESGDKTAVLVVARDYFGVAERGGITLETDRNIVNSTNIFVGYRDIDFKKLTLNDTAVAMVSNVG